MRQTLPLSNLSRRDLLAAGTGAMAALSLPARGAVNAPASPVAIVRCRDYRDFSGQLSSAFDKIGGIEKLVKGKTVALKLNLTGNPKRFPLTPDLPYRTDGKTVADTVHLFALAGAKRVRIIESFFPGDPGSRPVGALRHRRERHQQSRHEGRMGERPKSRQLQKVRSVKSAVGRIYVPGLPPQPGLYGM